MEVKVEWRVVSSLRKQQPALSQQRRRHRPPSSHEAEVVRGGETLSSLSPIALERRRPTKHVTQRVAYPVRKRAAGNSGERRCFNLEAPVSTTNVGGSD